MVRGEVWAFDGSINHEAWNNSADDRIVLIFDVWHPDLTEQERRDITSLLGGCLPSEVRSRNSYCNFSCSR